jgi:CRISPR-associated protein Csx10
MAEIKNRAWVTNGQLKEAFGQGKDSEAGFVLENLYLPEYEELRNGWKHLFEHYPGLFNHKDILETYTELRYQTKIDKETGTADDSSLRNIRLVDAGITFEGKLLLYVDSEVNEKILDYAFKNLRYVGAKRNRGCGNVKCTIKES